MADVWRGASSFSLFLPPRVCDLAFVVSSCSRGSLCPLTAMSWFIAFSQYQSSELSCPDQMSSSHFVSASRLCCRGRVLCLPPFLIVDPTSTFFIVVFGCHVRYLDVCSVCLLVVCCCGQFSLSGNNLLEIKGEKTDTTPLYCCVL